MSLEQGTRIDEKYEIIEKIGRGAYSNVYKAKVINNEIETEACRTICLKIASNPNVSFSHEYLVSFEIGQHNNLVNFENFGSTKMLENSTQTYKEYDYIVSELMPYGDMFKLVDKNSFDESCARYFFK